MTVAQKAALTWLRDHNGDGSYGARGNTLIAAGEIAPFTRATFNALRDAGYVEMYGERRIKLKPCAYLVF